MDYVVTSQCQMVVDTLVKLRHITQRVRQTSQAGEASLPLTEQINYERMAKWLSFFKILKKY